MVKMKIFANRMKDCVNPKDTLIEEVQKRSKYWVDLLSEEGEVAGAEERLLEDLEWCIKQKGKDTEEELEVLLGGIVDGLGLVEEPLMGLDGLVSIFRWGNGRSVLAAKGVVFLISEYAGEMADFFETFYQLLSPELFVKYEDEMVFLSLLVLRSEGLSLQMIRSIVKRLADISIRVPVLCAGRVLYVISATLNQHKRAVVPFKDRVKEGNQIGLTQFQPYLYELDALKDHPVLGELACQIKGHVLIDQNTNAYIMNRLLAILEE
ncbi:U3 small nucleolar RNA-associated protein 19 [Nematocida homosporus]|uniref:U3 small nucleolar RNA-associated protein 19 n=1 Tax=Nematocida homosporus TaxID=1912981 RepID=UPI0022202228|nr:U3 small nucleolar RNA-associated protein 19 [Nematocida homosporus]KAI5185384.1 U3 small nucleolar RNA-associated protein 19 [Nematocida homosporus]